MQREISDYLPSLDVSRETLARLEQYAELLKKWQAKINLVGPSTIPDLWKRHFIDSLQMIPYLPDKKTVIYDLGTGAGFPGLVLAIMGYTNVHLVESDNKKVLFLREVSRVTGTGVSIHQERIENLEEGAAPFIVSRACAPLDELLALSSRIVSRETICLFPKGKNYSTELDNAKKDWHFQCDIFPSTIDAESVILKLTSIGRK